MVTETITLILYLSGHVAEHTAFEKQSKCLKAKRTIERNLYKDTGVVRYSCENKTIYNKINVHELKILEDYSDLNQANVRDDKVEGSEDTITLVNNYVDQLPVDLDKDRLKLMIKEMFVEAQDSDIKYDNI